MSIEEIEAEILRLDARERARLAGKLLESLESLTPEENERLWLEEAQRRADELDSNPSHARASDQVLQQARSKLR